MFLGWACVSIVGVVSFLNVFGTCLSAKRSQNACQSTPGDAPYSLSCPELESTVTFPDGFHNRDGGIVFLVHGTFTSSNVSFGLGPYRTFLPSEGPGYDIAWFNSPSNSIEDAQVTAEYVAYNVKALAQRSKTGKVFVIGHSQGNINIQWALSFWPSIRSYVAGFISLAGDFHGTIESPLSCTAGDLLLGGCQPSVIQQTASSHYLTAQNAAGGHTLVPTTSLYTVTDEIIQPEIVNPTSNLPGASVIIVQQACPVSVVEHVDMLTIASAYFLTLDALAHEGRADLARFNSLTMCTYLSRSSSADPFAGVPAVITQAIADTTKTLTGTRVHSEPLLKSAFVVHTLWGVFNEALHSDYRSKLVDKYELRLIHV